jgi:predicted Zn-dependent protease
MLLQAGGQILGATLSATDPKVQAVATTVYGLGANLGYSLPHSRNQESEADRVGLRYMARAGYNPEAAVAFWQRFAELDRKGGGTLWFLRTHPLSETRIQQIKQWLPEAKAQYRPQN